MALYSPLGVEITDTIEAWRDGYATAIRGVINEIEKEARWQTELKMRGDPHADVVVDRILMVANTVREWADGVSAFL